jgi:hypothetical protein
MVHIEEVTEDEALELKNRGNAAFKQQNFAEADRLFTEALQLSSEQELKSVVLANRALVRMRMDHPARALEDATEALRLDRKNNKAAFRKGCCELQLRRLDEASETFRALESAGGMKDEVTNKLASVAQRKREQEAAEYDFASLYSLPAGSTTECVPFIGPVAVAQIPEKGRGVVVTRDVAAGEILFADKAFVLAKKSKLPDITVAKLRTCPKQTFEEFWALSDGTTVPDVQSTATITCARGTIDGQENPSGRKVDADRVRKVLHCNAHAAGTMDVAKGFADESDVTGLWLLGSMVNHCCRPTATRVFLGDMLICRAARDLKKGEEVTDGYVSLSQPAHARRQSLQDYGFTISDDRAIVEDWCFPEATAQSFLDRIDKLSAQVSGATLGKAVPQFASLAAEIETTCAERARLVGAPAEVVAAAKRIGTEAEIARLLCGGFTSVFVGLAFATKNLGRWEACAEAYWRCCSFQEQTAPYNAYHASWAWELMMAVRKLHGDEAAEPYAAYCRRVFRHYYGAGVFGIVAAEQRIKQATGVTEGDFPPPPAQSRPKSPKSGARGRSSPAGSPTSKVTAPPATAPEPAAAAATPAAAPEPAPATEAASDAMTHRVERVSPTTVRVVIFIGERDVQLADVQVASTMVTVRIAAEEVHVPIPQVNSAAAPPVKFSRKRKELSMELPVVGA